MKDFNDEDFIRYSDKKVKEETHNLAFYLATRISFYIILLFFAIFFCWYTVFVSTHSFYAVSGPSMMSTLNGDITDEMLHTEDVSDVSYDAVYVDRFTSPKIFDIIVVSRPGTTSIVKRLMATAGDYVTIAKTSDADGGEHFVFYRIPNGSDLTTFTDEEAEVDELSGANGYSIYSAEDWNAERSTYSINVDGFSDFSYEDNFFYTFLADFFIGQESGNGDYEYEFEYHVSSQGLVYVRVPEGQFFYMGDNRGHSTDARENGFMNVDNIVGRAEFIVYDYNFGNRLWEVIKFYFREIEKFFAR